jgi:hypothetical protein
VLAMGTDTGKRSHPLELLARAEAPHSHVA